MISFLHCDVVLSRWPQLIFFSLEGLKAFLHLIFPKSPSRVEYTLPVLGWTAAVVGLYLWRGLTDEVANIALLIIWNYIAFFVIWPRARQCGMPFMTAICALVPLFYIFLFVALMFRPPKYEFRSVSDATDSP
jgi:hypothetical protein